jgi:hypothetical protein
VVERFLLRVPDDVADEDGRVETHDGCGRSRKRIQVRVANQLSSLYWLPANEPTHRPAKTHRQP